MSTRRRLSTLAVAAALAAAGCGGDDAIEGVEREPEGPSPAPVTPAGNQTNPAPNVPSPDPGQG